jgi:hypothetical protein
MSSVVVVAAAVAALVVLQGVTMMTLFPRLQHYVVSFYLW